MSENERDTHFAGFASLLYENFLQLARDDEHSINEMLAADYPDKWRKMVETLIAQRAYDLAVHLIESVYARMYNIMGPTRLQEFTVESVMQEIPDLTKWPSDD